MVRLLRTPAVVLTLVVALPGCPGPHATLPASQPAPVLDGRAADPMRCENQRAPVRTPSACGDAVVVGEPLSGIPIDVEDRQPLPGRPPCFETSMWLCGQLVGGRYGSYALTCRNANDQPSGAVRLVAPDGSVLAEGACEQGRAVGTWLRWSSGHLAGAVTIVDGHQLGLRVFWSKGAYGHSVERGK